MLEYLNISGRLDKPIFCLAICAFLFTCQMGCYAQVNELTTAYSTQEDYREVFRSDYTYALQIIDSHTWWSDTLQKHDIDPVFALSIIFPELIRYSTIMDYIEVKGLEVLYVQYGKGYADFSIGFFQMKPSFAEHIETDILEYGLINLYPVLANLEPSCENTTETRNKRIIRLTDEYHQLLYLEAFFRIMDFKYRNHYQDIPIINRLQFYSTAYNSGYYKSSSLINEEMKKKRFYTGMESRGDRYYYWDISSQYFSGPGFISR